LQKRTGAAKLGRLRRPQTVLALIPFFFTMLGGVTMGSLPEYNLMRINNLPTVFRSGPKNMCTCGGINIFGKLRTILPLFLWIPDLWVEGKNSV
jgi:hypothetical protein